MVDLETMGTETNTKVLSIGAVRFRLDTRDDLETIMGEERSFYARLDLEEQGLKGRTESADTTEWWSRQSAEARAVFEEEPEGTVRALKRFTRFCRGAKRIWGNGNMFDNAIVRSLYEDFGMEYPMDIDRDYGFTADLDVRTLTRLWNLLVNVGSNKKRPTIDLGVAHNALDDARAQVLQCQIMFSQMKGSKYNEQV
jgi:hypothetical protein